jgi:hypothetical protein
MATYKTVFKADKTLCSYGLGEKTMPNWLRKSLVIIISILTFGMVSPHQASGFLSLETRNGDKSGNVQASIIESEEIETEEEDLRASFVDRVMKEAEQQSLEKFGARIGPVIEDEFRQLILPNIETVIASVAEQFPEEELTSLAITEVPGGGLSEKIFHIVGEGNKDIIRFHVRRDRPPHEGYWFNFHYHTHHDQFQTHYELGSIFWAKNTPPKWMT